MDGWMSGWKGCVFVQYNSLPVSKLESPMLVIFAGDLAVKVCVSAAETLLFVRPLLSGLPLFEGCLPCRAGDPTRN
jgi:hypothetical protein